MTDGGDQAAAGWYPDPYNPSRLRYWDGDIWTDHYHDGDGSLPGIGEWLGTTFSALGAYGFPALGLAVGASLIMNIVTSVGLRWTAGNAAIIDEEFVGSVGGVVWRAAVVLVIMWLVQGAVWLAINRFLQRAHLQADPTVGDAIAHAILRLPRLIGVTMLLILGLIAVLVVVALVIVVTQSEAIALLLLFALMPLAVWAMVKFSFISAAVVAAPLSTGAIAASASVSSGRFWPVLGRVLLLSIMVGVVAAMIGGALGDLASPIDQQALTDVFVTEGDTIEVSDFRFKDLLPDAADLVPYLIVASIINAISGLVTTSGFMRLYLDSGAPAELE